MYVTYPYGYRYTFTPVWATSSAEALELIKTAVQGERNDELFYDSLIQLSPDANQAAIIKSIRNDERGHNQMFRQMYKDLTGQEISGVSSEPVETVPLILPDCKRRFRVN